MSDPIRHIRIRQSNIQELRRIYDDEDCDRVRLERAIVDLRKYKRLPCLRDLGVDIERGFGFRRKR